MATPMGPTNGEVHEAPAKVEPAKKRQPAAAE
jgi:hypothetical protein